MQTFIHYFLHFGFPLVIATLLYPKEWKRAYILLLATMLIDLDHILANPIFKANRCSINYHPLHTYYAAIVYIGLLFFKKPIRIIGIGLLFHLLTDFLDCFMMYSNCPSCLENSPIQHLLEFIHVNIYT